MTADEIPMTLSERARMLFHKAVGSDEYMIYRCDSYQEVDCCGNSSVYRGVRCYCTACETESWFDRVSREVSTGYGCSKAKQQGFADEYGEAHWQGENFRCPHCDEEVKLYHVSQLDTHTRIKWMTLMDTVRVGDVPVIINYYAVRWISKDGRNGYDFLPMEAYAVEEYETEKKHIKRRRVAKYTAGVSSPCSAMGVAFNDYWERKANTKLTMCVPDLMIEPEPGITVGTLLEKSGLESYLSHAGAYADRYLAAWVRHPNVENLAMQAPWLLMLLLSECSHTEGCYYWTRQVGEKEVTGIRWDKVKPHEMLGMEKREMKMLEAARWPSDKLLFYMTVRMETGERLSEEVMSMNFYEKGSALVTKLYVDDLKKHGVSVERVIRYLAGQKGRFSKHASVHDLLDTWHMLRDRIGRLTEDVMWPKRLIETHDREVELKKNLKVESLNPMIHERFRQLSEYSWEDKGLGLCIRPAASGTELHDEGCALHHCVETYAGKVASGATAIFFIRKRSRRRESFYTLELDEERMEVRQNRGLRNCPRTPEVEAFEEKWLEYAKKVKMNTEVKHGKSCRYGA